MNVKPSRTSTVAAAAIVLALTALVAPAGAQNVAIVNGKAVPVSRVETLLDQAKRAGQQITPELETQAREEVVRREILSQAAEEAGIPAQPGFAAQLEVARQSVLIRELVEGFKAKNPVSDEEAKAEYEKFKGQSTGTEYRARHILVEKEDEAKKILAQLAKPGAKFDELAKKFSKDTGSAVKGGDLDFADPANYVPEFSAALTLLKKGEITKTPVKSQFGFHIIKLEDTRPRSFPAFDDVKAQIVKRLGDLKLQKYVDDIKNKAKTDFKFSN